MNFNFVIWGFVLDSFLQVLISRFGARVLIWDSGIFSFGRVMDAVCGFSIMVWFEDSGGGFGASSMVGNIDDLNWFRRNRCVLEEKNKNILRIK